MLQQIVQKVKEEMLQEIVQKVKEERGDCTKSKGRRRLYKK